MAERVASRPSRRLTIVGVAALLAAFGLMTVARADPSAGDLRTLVANVLGGLSQLTGTPAASDAPMEVGLALSRPDPAAEEAYYRSVYDPSSPSYHHFLTPSQFDRRFGVPVATWRRAAGWVQSKGLQVQAGASHDYLLARGTVGQVQHAFGTEIQQFQSGATTFLANTGAPQVPASLPILSVLGLNTFQRFSTPARPAATASAAPATAPLANVVHGTLGAVGNTVKAATSVNVGITTPQNLWSVYQQPAAYRGAGQRVAIFGAGASAVPVADLAAFETKFGLPHVPVTVNHVGTGPFNDTSGSVEWDIDMQAAVGMAPDLDGLTLYFGSSLVDASVAGMLSAWVADPDGPAQANASFGECERTPLDPLLLKLPLNVSQNPNPYQTGIALGNNLEPVGEQMLRQAAIEGRTLFSSSGDTGSSCPVVVLGQLGAGNGVLNQILPLTSYPASSQYAVAVGGTVLYTNGAGGNSRFLEYAWPFGGGGGSFLIPAPSYQRGVQHNFLPCLISASGDLGVLGKPCRGIPDVAAQSGDSLTNGYAIVAGGVDAQGGGTSLSSPLWAGMWARVNQSAGGPGYGFANEVLYRLGQGPTKARDFTDVTVGVNGLYTALPGWDYVSGFGTPNLTNLIADAR